MSKHKSKISKKQVVPAEMPISTNLNSTRIKPSIVAIIVLAVVSIALYINTLRNDYALDDSMVLIRNEFTQNGVSGIADIFKYDTFTGFWAFNDSTKTIEEIVAEKKLLPGGRYRPFSLMTFALEIELFGKDFYDENMVLVGKGCPVVNHAVNVIYYVLTVILLFIILCRLFPLKDKNWWFSLPFIATLLFAIHPIHTEVVANVKGRDEILTLLGSLIALWASVKFIDKQKFYFLVISFIGLLVGLFSKENAITFLAIIPITLYFFTNAKWKQIGLTMLPLVLSSAIFLFVRGQVLGWEHNADTSQEIMNNPFLNMDFAEKYGTIFVTLLMYIKLLFMPHPLTFDYYPWQIAKTDLFSPTAFISVVIYLLLGIYAIYGMVKKKNVLSFAVLIFLIALSPVCNIFFSVGTLMNERFIYISSIGFCIIIAWLLAEKFPKWFKSKMLSNYVVSILGIIILCLCSLKVVSRNADWENDTVLFCHDVEISSNSAKSNCAAGGRTLEKAQSETVKDDKELHDALCQKAIKYLKKSNEIYTSDGTNKGNKHIKNAVYTDAVNLLGNAYFELGDLANALTAYHSIQQVYPGHIISSRNMRIVLTQTPTLLFNKKVISTIPELLTAIGEIVKTQPNCGEAYHALGVIYGRELNNIEASLQCFEKAEQISFDKTAAYYKDLGVVYGISGNYTKAVTALEKAIELDPEDGTTLINLGYTYMNLGMKEQGQAYIDRGNLLKQEKQNDK